MSEERASLDTVEGLLGKKLKMTQLFTEDGTVVPVTVLEVGPCTVLQVKTAQSDGYHALQLGFGTRKDKRVKKPQRAHYKKAGAGGQAFVREVAYAGEEPPLEMGASIGVDQLFEAGVLVDVIGISKGRGFAGTIKRHNFARGPMTHGSHNKRRPGSIGQAADPARVFKGMKGPGQMGNKRVTVENLEVVRVDVERNLLMVKGGVPGPSGSYLVIRKAKFAR